MTRNAFTTTFHVSDGTFKQGEETLTQWGTPKTLDDLTQIFLDYLHSKIPTTPFSPTPLSEESLTILSHLEKLTEKGWWTVGSQPAVSGAKSSDPVFGWGPRAGYVFQKCFVEFFCEENDTDVIEKRVEAQGGGWVHYFACNNEVCFVRILPVKFMVKRLSGCFAHKCSG